MSFDIIKSSLRNDRSYGDLRPYELELREAVQLSLANFLPIKKESYASNPIQVIDFFCGAGGTSLGFAALNSVIPAFKMLGGCDINKVSATTYSHNYGTPIVNEDITRLAYEEGALESFLEYIGYDKTKPTILIGCAPCQGFSSHRKKHWNEEDDIRNSLIMAFAEIVKRMRPDVIIMENVPEFLSKKYWKYFSAAKACYEQCDYIIKNNIYNAASFGVAQERFRSIIIGMKKEFLLPEGHLKPFEYRTVRDAISYLPPVLAGAACPNDPMHRSASHKESTLEVIRQVPHNGGNRPIGV